MPAIPTALLRPRFVHLAVFLVCAGLLGFGYWLQFGAGLEPCPLCVFQRIAFMAVGTVALIAAIHGPGRTGVMVYGVLLSLIAFAGAGIAGRQVWLQHLPPEQVPECGPGLDYLLEVFPLTETVRMVFSGSGECAEVDWTFLGLSIAEWSLGWFVLLLGAAVASMFLSPGGNRVTSYK